VCYGTDQHVTGSVGSTVNTGKIIYNLRLQLAGVLYLAGLALSVGANRQLTALLIAGSTNVDMIHLPLETVKCRLS